MNLLLFNHSELLPDGNSIILTGRRLEHVTKILKLKHGETIRVGLIGGKKGSGQISIENDGIVLINNIHLYLSSPMPINCELLIALPRPQMVKRIIQQATTIGVKRIHFFATKKVEKSYWQSPILDIKSLQEQKILGAEQAGTTYLPEVSFSNEWEDFLTKLQNYKDEDIQKFVLHPGNHPYPREEVSPSRLTIAAIGPEGGFTFEEFDSFISLDYLPYSLGDRILRVETAVVYFLGKVF